jgi:hypothetical protein
MKKLGDQCKVVFAYFFYGYHLNRWASVFGRGEGGCTPLSPASKVLIKTVSADITKNSAVGKNYAIFES